MRVRVFKLMWVFRPRPGNRSLTVGVVLGALVVLIWIHGFVVLQNLEFFGSAVVHHEYTHTTGRSRLNYRLQPDLQSELANVTTHAKALAHEAKAPNGANVHRTKSQPTGERMATDEQVLYAALYASLQHPSISQRNRHGCIGLGRIVPKKNEFPVHFFVVSPTIQDSREATYVTFEISEEDRLDRSLWLSRFTHLAASHTRLPALANSLFLILPSLASDGSASPAGYETQVFLEWALQNKRTVTWLTDEAAFDESLAVLLGGGFESGLRSSIEDRALCPARSETRFGVARAALVVRASSDSPPPSGSTPMKTSERAVVVETAPQDVAAPNADFTAQSLIAFAKNDLKLVHAPLLTQYGDALGKLERPAYDIYLSQQINAFGLKLTGQWDSAQAWTAFGRAVEDVVKGITFMGRSFHHEANAHFFLPYVPSWREPAASVPSQNLQRKAALGEQKILRSPTILLALLPLLIPCSLLDLIFLHPFFARWFGTGSVSEQIEGKHREKRASGPTKTQVWKKFEARGAFEGANLKIIGISAFTGYAIKKLLSETWPVTRFLVQTLALTSLICYHLLFSSGSIRSVSQFLYESRNAFSISDSLHTRLGLLRLASTFALCALMPLSPTLMLFTAPAVTSTALLSFLLCFPPSATKGSRGERLMRGMRRGAAVGVALFVGLTCMARVVGLVGWRLALWPKIGRLARDVIGLYAFATSNAWGRYAAVIIRPFFQVVRKMSLLQAQTSYPLFDLLSLLSGLTLTFFFTAVIAGTAEVRGPAHADVGAGATAAAGAESPSMKTNKYSKLD